MEKQIDYGSYSAYKQTMENLTADLEELLQLSDEICLVNTAKSLEETIAKTKDELSWASSKEESLPSSTQCWVRRYCLLTFCLRPQRSTE